MKYSAGSPAQKVTVNALYDKMLAQSIQKEDWGKFIKKELNKTIGTPRN